MLADAQFCLRSLGETSVPADTAIRTSPLPSDVTPTNNDGKDNLFAELALTTNNTPSFIPITVEEVGLSQNDEDFCRTMCTRLGKRDRVSFPFYGDSILSRSVNGFKQVIKPQSFGAHVLHVSHHAKMASRLGGRHMYQFL